MNRVQLTQHSAGSERFCGRPADVMCCQMISSMLSIGTLKKSDSVSELTRMLFSEMVSWLRICMKYFKFTTEDARHGIGRSALSKFVALSVFHKRTPDMWILGCL